MTREEAINLYWNVRYNLANEKQKTALDVAFDALREQGERKCPCDLCRYNPPSSMDGKPCTMCPASAKEEV